MASSHLTATSGKDYATTAESVAENEIDESESVDGSEQYDSEDEDEQYDSEDEDEQQAKIDEAIIEVTGVLRGLRTLISKSAELILKMVGEDEETCNMRKNVLKELEKLEGLTRPQVIGALRRLNNNDNQLKLFYAMDNEADRLLLVHALLRE